MNPPMPKPSISISTSIQMKLVSSTAVATASGSSDLIPGLPNDVAELCLLHLPFPHFSLARSVSSTWNQALSSPSFLRSKSSLALSLPHLFVLAFNPSDHRIQWQALDPRSRRWFVLPPMPADDAGTGAGVRICGASLACASDKERREIYVIGGLKGEEIDASVAVYSAASNSWRVGKGRMKKRRAFCAAAAAIGGRVFVAGGGDGGVSTEVECYDPARDRWDDVAGMTCGIARYDAAVVGRKLLVTEGWTWPFNFTPRGSVYDADLDTWQDMSPGMREGWTGASAVVGPTLFIVLEYGEGKVKAYHHVSDSWSDVAGTGIPAGVRKPYTVTGAEEGRIYVVGRGLDVGIGSVVEEKKGKWRIEWEVVKGPRAFVELAPCSSQLLYA